jgi:multidrug efflux pump subunit AcrB
MTICRFSITRPVATTVLMLLLVTFGLVSLQRLPVRELPDIEEPTISISTLYEGASAAVVETRITQVKGGCFREKFVFFLRLQFSSR